jgi:hypothetical protein
MPVTNYPYGFNHGVSIRGMPVLNTYGGNVFWVNSVSGSNGNVGTRTEPFATLDYAIGQCTANNGDVIVLAENHAESLVAATDAVDFDVAGITVVGLGNGDDRPTFTFATSTGANVVVDAANIEIGNCVFVCNIASQTNMISLSASADGAFIHDCEFREGSATGLSMIEWLGAADNVRIWNNRFYAPTAGNYDEAILIASTPTRWSICGNFIYGDWDEGGINNAVGNIATLGEISYNQVTNLLTNVPAINLDSACTGMMSGNYLSTDTYATSIDTGTMRTSGNYWADASADVGGVPVPAASPVVDSVAGALFGTGGIGTFPSAAVAGNGVSIAEVLRYVHEQQTPRIAIKAHAALGTSHTTGLSPVTDFTVTGDVMVRVVGVVGATPITSTGGTGTLSVGTAEIVTAILGTTTADGTQFAATDVWVDTSPANDAERMTEDWVIIGGGADIVTTIATNSMTAGTLTLYCFWIPLSAGATVVAA